jgi:5-methylcytosine-specific restriction endonuclease McrA
MMTSTNNRQLKRKSLRLALYIQADGKCQMCGDTLSASWHADHIIPYTHSGRTNPHEMQALCRPCNLKKGAKLPTKGSENANVLEVIYGSES